ncbi:hypothetical protein KIPE111705_22640 [Kibdelosporangium persicum]|uniref:DUF2157 domain-containing protein n=1 Tax=Kibdelosporangium persicum TaxID=2698649 RepID=A0ABX2FFX2_9PSEU|nr:hypothetical protein [Kibdelosporangium persicum]NRN69630.1 hypothetical protein [Kibdelosporangium persicum]
MSVQKLMLKVSPRVQGAADELHVAAILESEGVNDRIAREEYGHKDVFALAAEVYKRMPEPTPPATKDAPKPAREWSLRIVAHGPLYVLPSAVYPAVLMSLGGSAMVIGLVIATAIGWVWGMGMSSVAYQLLGHGRPNAAARMLRWLGLAGLVLGAGVGVLLAGLLEGGDVGLVVFVVAQMGYQLACGVLFFYHREARLAMLMLPVVIIGMVHIISGYPANLVLPAVIAGASSAALVLAAATLATFKKPEQADPRTPAARSEVVLAAVRSACYGALCAAILLFTDARFVAAEFDLAIAVAPLVLGMGAVEWRAHRFVASSSAELHRQRSPEKFRQEVWRLFLHELVLCLMIVGGLGVTLMFVLRSFDALTIHGAILINAHMVLGGAFFVGFVLMRHERFTWLLGCLAVIVAANITAVTFLADLLAPHGEVSILLFSGIALLLVFLVAVRRGIGRVHLYR